jgi:hypothetical protein
VKICSRCGSIDKIEYHHIIYKSDHGETNDCNLTPLCKGCHDYRHAKEDIEAHLKQTKSKNQVERILVWEYRLQVLESLNTPELIRLHGYTKYWTDIKTHYLPREKRLVAIKIREEQRNLLL